MLKTPTPTSSLRSTTLVQEDSPGAQVQPSIEEVAQLLMYFSAQRQSATLPKVGKKPTRPVKRTRQILQPKKTMSKVSEVSKAVKRVKFSEPPITQSLTEQATIPVTSDDVKPILPLPLRLIQLPSALLSTSLMATPMAGLSVPSFNKLDQACLKIAIALINVKPQWQVPDQLGDAIEALHTIWDWVKPMGTDYVKPVLPMSDGIRLAHACARLLERLS